MATHTAPEVFEAAVGETFLASVSFAGYLDDGETLTGTPTVAEQSTAQLTISGQAVNTSAKTINGLSVAIGQAVQFTVSGQLVAGSPYSIKITVTTTAGATRILYVRVVVIA